MTIPNILVGGLTVIDAVFGISHSKFCNDSLPPADGMIGMDVLANWDVDFDASGNRLWRLSKPGGFCTT